MAAKGTGSRKPSGKVKILRKEKLFRWLVVFLFTDYKGMHNEAVTTNREIVANHLAYTHLYMFLVADWIERKHS